jgi:hypothetical protein
MPFLDPILKTASDNDLSSSQEHYLRFPWHKAKLKAYGSNKRIMAVGSYASCEVHPHVQSFAFAFSCDALDHVRCDWELFRLMGMLTECLCFCRFESVLCRYVPVSSVTLTKYKRYGMPKSA